MAKNYKLNSKSDMNRFARDLEKDIFQQAEEQMLSDTYDIECPSCGKEVKAVPGKNICSACGEDIELNLNINWD